MFTNLACIRNRKTGRYPSLGYLGTQCGYVDDPGKIQSGPGGHLRTGTNHAHLDDATQPLPRSATQDNLLCWIISRLNSGVRIHSGVGVQK